jgi:hypothetical protein
MRQALKVAATIAIGVALGLAATWVTAIRGTMSGDISDGPWTSLDTGSSEGGLYLRARIAVHGLLVLSREETVYYSALRDSAGAPNERLPVVTAPTTAALFCSAP